jgi:hypothetical protein
LESLLTKIPVSTDPDPSKVCWEINDAIKNAQVAKGSNIDVKDSDCPDGFYGNKPDLSIKLCARISHF